MAEAEQEEETVGHLSDEQLRGALEGLGVPVGPITPTTRHLLEQELVRRRTGSKSDSTDQGEAQHSSTKVKHSSSDSTKDSDSIEGGGGAPGAQHTVKVFPDASLSRKHEAQVYYGIFLPDGVNVEDTGFQKVYTDKGECLAIMKKYRGSRFKAFPTHQEALTFADLGPVVAPSTSSGEGGPAQSPSLSVEKPSPFRGPKSQELVKFRKAIESDNMEFFCECIEDNPRYLVSSGDTPAVLQEGFRYNSLHVACRNHRPAFVSKVLSTVSRVEFFQKLYPDDCMETSARRSGFLLDLYLNTPDKGLNETPLHFASKHGSLECVRVLTSYPACDRNRTNKFGQKPIEIVCSRVRTGGEALTEEITRQLGEQWFVPLLRDDDLCLLPQVGRPWSPQLTSPTSSASLDHLSLSPASPVSPSLKVRALAGPMSPSQAEQFQQAWRCLSTASPTRNRPRQPSLRLTDQEKGLERLGRDMAVERKVQWQEYWDFLEDFVNLSTDQGLTRLETFLRDKFKQLMKERTAVEASELNDRLSEQLHSPAPSQDPNTTDDGVEGNVSGLSECSRSTFGDLCQELEALRLNASLSPQQEAPHQAVTSCSRKFLESVKTENWKEDEEASLVKTEVGEEASARQQLSYIVKSVEVSAHRLAEMLGELARDLQCSTVASLSLPRTVRNKLRPEVVCLRKVLTKCFTKHQQVEDVGFIHILLATKTTQHLQDSLTPSDLSILAETMKIFVSHLSFVQLDSSDEEACTRPTAEQLERENTAQHFSCVLHCLEQALTIAYNNCGSSPDQPSTSNNGRLHLLPLDDCTCYWKPSQVIKNCNLNKATISPVSSPGSNTKYKKAFNFLHNTLFSEGTSSPRPLSKLDGSVVKHLPFNEEEEEEEEEVVVLEATLEVKDGGEVAENIVKRDSSEAADLTQQPDGGTQHHRQEEDEEEEEGSFTSAVSSVEDVMLTPEEGVQVFINGVEPSKVDQDVLTAIGERHVDHQRFPHLHQWLCLVSSYSELQRNHWASPYRCRRRRVLTPDPPTHAAATPHCPPRPPHSQTLSRGLRFITSPN